MTDCELTYFHIRGRAEPARLMLEDHGASYTNRFLTLEEWPKVKSTFKYGQVPVFRDGDRVIEESFAIYSYLARKYDLLPKTEDDLIRHDQINSLTLAASTELGMIFWDPQFEDKRTEMREKRLPVRLSNLEKILSETKGPYCIEAQVYYCDYILWAFLDTVRMFDADIISGYPRVCAFKKAFESRPRIHAYLNSERRPLRFTVPIATFGGHEDPWRPEAI